MMLSSKRLLFLCITLVVCSLIEAATDKKGEKTSSPPPPKDKAATNMFVDFSKFEVFELLRAAAILVGFIFAFLGDKKGEIRVWQLAESIFMGLIGLGAFFFPRTLLDYIFEGKMDTLHLYLYQAVGASSVGFAVVSYRQCQTNSKDSQVAGGWLLSRVLGVTFFMVNGIHTKLTLVKESPRFSCQATLLNGLGFGLLLIGSVIKLWQHHGCDSGAGRSSSRGKPGSILNQHLLFSMLLLLPGMIMYFGMPHLISDISFPIKLDGIHFHLLRTLGALGLMRIFQEMTALQYENDGDKRDLFIGHIVTLLLAMPLMYLTQYKHSIFPVKLFYIDQTIIFAYLGNCLCAVYIRIKDKKY